MFKHFFARTLMTLCGLSAYAATASPWIDPSNTRTRHHLQYLIDSGAIQLPVTTWPLPWASISQALDETDTNQLSTPQAWSVNYLRHELSKAMNEAYTQAHSHLSAEIPMLEGFERNSRETKELSSSITYTGDTLAFRLAGT